MKEILEKYNELQTKINEVNRDFASILKVEMEKAFDLALEDFPEIEGFVWTQYTPYFNDGDACTFEVNDGSALLVGETKDDVTTSAVHGDTLLHASETYTPKRYKELMDLVKTEERWKKLWEAEKNLNQILFSVPEDVLLSAFGDSVFILYVRGEGFTVDEYDHD